MKECVQTLILSVSTYIMMYYSTKVDAYYSRDCIDSIGTFIIKKCPQIKSNNKLNILCKSGTNLCHHFICAHPSKILKGTLAYKVKNEFCLIPDSSLREGILKLAPNFMECSKDVIGMCFNGECIQSRNIQIDCKKGACSILNNAANITMTKPVFYKKHRYNYKVSTYKSVKKKEIELPKYSMNRLLTFLIIFIVIILLIWLMASCYKKICRKRDILSINF
ncbi:hypothetical protein HZS_1535 [Henneguya salminicola]|nr:hypothetical protein HZS_1535 [Henneguya salminicola]